MRQSKSLIFYTSENSPDSKWMPWELGFFDGNKPGHVAILPLVKTQGASFSGQEYLGLYPPVEEISLTDRTPRLGSSPAPNERRNFRPSPNSSRCCPTLRPTGYHLRTRRQRDDVSFARRELRAKAGRVQLLDPVGAWLSLRRVPLHAARGGVSC